MLFLAFCLYNQTLTLYPDGFASLPLFQNISHKPVLIEDSSRLFANSGQLRKE